VELFDATVFKLLMFQ
jgi:uncharacterized oligopeptide transporter (OPT) family protein